MENINILCQIPSKIAALFVVSKDSRIFVTMILRHAAFRNADMTATFDVPPASRNDLSQIDRVISSVCKRDCLRFGDGLSAKKMINQLI